MWAKKKQVGFTIVELLIVIVVIAVLATISVVAFNGVQERAQNARTISAANTWLKAMKMYESEKGEYPHFGWDSCLGEGYPWDYEATASGSNQCLGTSTANYYVESKSVPLANALKQYVSSSLPSPNLKAIGNSATWRRGMLYQAPAVGGYFTLAVMLVGTTPCPILGGLTVYATNSFTGGVECLYRLGMRLR